MHVAQYIARLSLGVTRRLYPWGLAMLSIIHCISQLGTPTIQYNMHIIMQSYQLHFLPYQKVHYYTSHNCLELKDAIKATVAPMKARNFGFSNANCITPQLQQFYAHCSKG